jgi:hypothetical protein
MSGRVFSALHLRKPFSSIAWPLGVDDTMFRYAWEEDSPPRPYAARATQTFGLLSPNRVVSTKQLRRRMIQRAQREMSTNEAD